MIEQREPERYAELLLLLEGTAAARAMLEGLIEDGEPAVELGDVETAVEPLRAIGRVPPLGAVVGGRGRPLVPLGPSEAEAALQEFRAGAIPVDFSGEERDDLDRVVGALVAIQLEAGERGSELIDFEDSGELVAYHAEWGVATVPGGGGVLARLDLEFREPRRASTRLLFDVTSHQWALRAMELTGRCIVKLHLEEEADRRIRVRAPRSAQLAGALTVVRMLDQMALVFEEV
jgi:hypothetical protein